MPDPAIVLTQAHRLAQAKIGAATVRAQLAAFKVLDPEALDATVAKWLRVAVPIVQGQRTASARLAANYLTALRAIELPDVAPITAVLDELADVKAVQTSLTVTGPLRIKQAMLAGQTLEQATETAMVSSARAGLRHALDGGRGTIVKTVNVDDRAIGYVRVTGVKPCAFCAMVASRGAVYKTEMSAEMAAVGARVRGTRQPGDRYHDGCQCTAKPVYAADDPQLAESERYAALWGESTEGLGGKDALNAFRQALAKTA